MIAAECVRQGALPEAFTVRFDGDETDLPYARHVAQRLDLKHTVVDAHAASLAQRFDEILYHYDEPFADSSALALFALADAIGGRYRVVLDGDGGDEAFGGYRHYEYIGVKQAVKAAAAAAGLCDGAGTGRTGVYVHSKVCSARRIACDCWTTRFAKALSLGLIRWRSRNAETNQATCCSIHSHRSRTGTGEWTDVKMDIALGAFGMEGRAPLLDHAVLEWGQTLPPRELVKGREKKVLLRAAYEGELPCEVLNRPKHGFGAPVNRWMEGPLRESVRKSLPCPWFADAPQRGVEGQRLWTLFAFAAWAERWGARW